MWKSAIPYIDDIIIFSKSFKEHLMHLRQLFTKVKEANFFLKLRKCEFLMESMEYLGHHISAEGIMPSPEKVKAVLHMPVPKDSKAVKRFLGLGSYYRKFIKNYAARTHQLRLLTRKDHVFKWTDDCHKEFEDKKMLSLLHQSWPFLTGIEIL